MTPADYDQLIAALQRPAPRLHRSWDARHPAWHQPGPPPEGWQGAPGALMDRFAIPTRLACLHTMVDCCAPMVVQWRALATDADWQFEMLDDVVPRALPLLEAALAGGRPADSELDDVYGAAREAADNFDADDWAVFYCLRGLATALYPLVPDRDDYEPTSEWAFSAPTVWAWFWDSLPGHRGVDYNDECEEEEARFVDWWWRRCRCRLACRDAATATIEFANVVSEPWH